VSLISDSTWYNNFIFSKTIFYLIISLKIDVCKTEYYLNIKVFVWNHDKPTKYQTEINYIYISIQNKWDFKLWKFKKKKSIKNNLSNHIYASSPFDIPLKAKPSVLVFFFQLCWHQFLYRQNLFWNQLR
jgi:hypothetical protein